MVEDERLVVNEGEPRQGHQLRPGQVEDRRQQAEAEDLDRGVADDAGD